MISASVLSFNLIQVPVSLLNTNCLKRASTLASLSCLQTREMERKDLETGASSFTGHLEAGIQVELCNTVTLG